MKVLNWKISDKKLNIKPSAAVIGNFDGVHRGHLEVLKNAKEFSSKLNLPLSVLTFDPHPREFFSKEKTNFLLQTVLDKAESLSKNNIDYLINLKFDDLLSELSPEQFVEKVLSESLSLKHIFVGKDFKFGKDRAGDINSLKSFGLKYRIGLSSIKLKNQDGTSISSTKIRNNLKKGKIKEANELLGRPYMISGLVIEGDKRGRQIGFPTANISLGKLIRPAFGVYAVLIEGLENKVLRGIANIGRRPTVNDRGVLLEVNIFDFNEDIYGKKIFISLIDFIRDEKKFDGIENLKKQIVIDVKLSKSILGNA
jgi:riboflavin kinase/FMN adenylyltransferase